MTTIKEAFTMIKQIENEYGKKRKNLADIQCEDENEDLRTADCCLNCEDRVMGEMVSDNAIIIFCTISNKLRPCYMVCKAHKRMDDKFIHGEGLKESVDYVRNLHDEGYL